MGWQDSGVCGGSSLAKSWPGARASGPLAGVAPAALLARTAHCQLCDKPPILGGVYLPCPSARWWAGAETRRRSVPRFLPLAKWIVSLRSALGAVARIAWRQPAGFRQALRPALSRAVAPPCHSGAQETSAGGRRKPVLAPHLLRFLHGCVHADNRLCSAVFGIH